jgi:RNA polymerase sigma-70 factor (ECF subfamily)
LPPSDSSILRAQKYELIDPDVRLMLQVREGIAAAFEELVKKHQQRLVQILTHLVSDRARAEELAQDVFLRVYRARENYTPTAKFSTWLYTITHNVASNARRKQSRRKEVNLGSTTPSGSNVVRPLDSMAKDKSALMPARVADHNELSEVLHESIGALPERQRMAMLLSRFEEMSYDEIAKTMKLTPQAVKSLLSRARENLRIILQPYVDTGQREHKTGGSE